MKNIAYISAFSLWIFFFCACNKNEPGVPGEPEPLLNRLDSIVNPSKPFPKKTYVYDANNRFRSEPAWGDVSGEIYGTTYSYNSEGLVNKIRVSDYTIANDVVTEILINYQNGIPVTGKLKHTPYQNKPAYPYYETDSIVYKATNGKVTEIKHIDHKVYQIRNNQLEMISSTPGTKSIHTLTYQGNNLTKIETTNAAFAKVMTYGTKKGIFSAYRQKFVLWENENPTFSAENDLISIVEPFNKNQPPKWEKTTYAYQYNAAGYPKSSVVSRTDVNGQPLETYNLKYFYK
jgi:hypothetical protein